jgi:hypothetical protein
VDSSGTVLWATDGVPICTTKWGQESPRLVSDRTGGAIITWSDGRSDNWKIYAQRVDASGAVQWDTNAVAICSAAEDQSRPHLISDGAGGAILTWDDDRGDIYAQRIDASGTVLWDTDGVAICTATGSQWCPQLVPDGTGGAIIAWGGREIRAQRVNSSGEVLWDNNGVVVCPPWDEQWAGPQLVSDGAGGAIITWQDYRNGYAHIDIYAQKVDASGTVQWDTNGVAICTAIGNQDYPQLASDGSGGAIII